MITYVSVPIGDGCATPCASCRAGSAPAVPRPVADVTAGLARARSTWASGPGPNVAFTGLDAFSHPHLPALIDAARAAGFDRIQVTTDGRFLDQGGNALGAWSAGVTHMRLFILAGDAEHHDRLLGHAGAFDSAARGARAFLAAGPGSLLSGVVPMCRHCAPHASAAVAALASMGAAAVELDVTALRRTAENDALVRAAQETAIVNRLAPTVVGGDSPAEGTAARGAWRLVERP